MPVVSRPGRPAPCSCSVQHQPDGAIVGTELTVDRRFQLCSENRATGADKSGGSVGSERHLCKRPRCTMSGLNREHTWAYFNIMKPDGPRDDVMGQGGNNVKPVTQSTADWQAGYLAA